MFPNCPLLLFLLVSYCSIVVPDENPCSKQRDKYFQCMRSLHTSSEAKLLKDKNQVVAQQCGISQVNVQCWRTKDTCQNDAEQIAESSSVKTDALEADNRCWQTIGSSSTGLFGSADYSGANGPAPGSGDPLSPPECIPTYDADIAGCTANLLQQDQLFIAANQRLKYKAKQCQDQWPQQCKPQNPSLVECLYIAYEKLTNLTMNNFRTCMEKAGYQLPGTSGRLRQIFPL